MRRILDVKYEKSDLNNFMTKQCQHLTATERHKLLHLLKKFEDLFAGTFGTWKTTPVGLELQDDAKLVCLRPYPVPKLHENLFKKEFKRLVSLEVLEEANDSKWGVPYFSQPKSKTNRVRFLSDFHNLNMQLELKPYPMPKICEILLNLEGFQYNTSLDLNMGYYHIHISKQDGNLCMIILTWVKYWYKRLPMGVRNFPDIF